MMHTRRLSVNSSDQSSVQILSEARLPVRKNPSVGKLSIPKQIQTPYTIMRRYFTFSCNGTNWLPESATDDPFSLTHHLAV
jgi:hypothetical protein